MVAAVKVHLRLINAVTLFETVHASAGIDQLLTPREKRMAFGADFDLELALDGAAQKGFAACAANHGFAVCRMDIFLHVSPS